MLTNSKTDANERLSISDVNLDLIMETYLRPLRSRIARRIFRIILNQGSEGKITTFDIEAKLLELGLNLDKKEINGWLSSMQEAGLISKEEARGKPTTMPYNKKYTFDLWKITDLGLETAEKLYFLAFKTPSQIEEDVATYLTSIGKLDTEKKIKAIQKNSEIFILLKSLKVLSDNEGRISNAEINEQLRPQSQELDIILSKYSDRKSNKPLVIRSASQRTLVNRFRSILGLPSGSLYYSLTEEGKRVAEALRH